MKNLAKVLPLIAISSLVGSNLGIANNPAKLKPIPSGQKPIIVAVIDSGISDSFKDSKFLCKFGHRDFTGTGLNDTHGHGTHISGLIDQYAKGIVLDNSYASVESILNKPIKYCQVILKYYDPGDRTFTLDQELKALRFAINIKVDIINLSGGGKDFVAEEAALIKEALDAGIKVVVAAGNEGADLSEKPYYPAVLDKRIFVVGNMTKQLSFGLLTNYGTKVNAWEFGMDRMSYGVDRGIASMTGTSQAAAIYTGKMVHDMLVGLNLKPR